MPTPKQRKQKKSTSLWASLKLFDNYRWATLLALGISLPLLIFLIATNSFFAAEWFFDLLAIFNFVNAPVSSSGYIATMVKGFVLKPASTTNHQSITSSIEPTLFNWRGVPVNRSLPKNEKRGTLIGAAVGIAASIALIVFGATIPFFNALSFFADCLFTISTVGNFAGLGNRLGSCLDKYGSRLPNEKCAMKYAAAAGLIFGTLLVCFKVVAVVAAASVTTIATGGVALPLWIAGAIAITSCTSTAASAADYASKAVNFTRVAIANNQNSALTKQVENRYHEYRGAAVGVGLGIATGIAIAALLIPHVLFGALAVAAAATVIVACVAIIGSLCSRIGRLIDGYKNCKKQLAEQQAAIAATENSLQPDVQPEPPTAKTITPVSSNTPAAITNISPASPPSPSLITTATPVAADAAQNPTEEVRVQRDQHTIRALIKSPTFFNKANKKEAELDYPRFVTTNIANNIATPRLSAAVA